MSSLFETVLYEFEFGPFSIAAQPELSEPKTHFQYRDKTAISPETKQISNTKMLELTMT